MWISKLVWRLSVHARGAGFRGGIIAQPDWRSSKDFARLGKPNLFFGVTAGNMDSMVNRYTSDKRIRSDDAYTPGGEGGKRPDRSVIVYSQRVREAFSDVPLVIGGIEASLRRIAHSTIGRKGRRTVLLDAKADLLCTARRTTIVEDRASLAKATKITRSRSAWYCVCACELHQDWMEIDSTTLDTPASNESAVDPYAMEGVSKSEDAASKPGLRIPHLTRAPSPRRQADNSRRPVPPRTSAKREPPIFACQRRSRHQTRFSMRIFAILHVESNRETRAH